MGWLVEVVCAGGGRGERLVAGVALLGVPAAVASGGQAPIRRSVSRVGSEPHGVAVDETTDTIYAANLGRARCR